MSPETVFFAVRAIVRLGTATRDAYEQRVRNKDIPMPLPTMNKPDPMAFALFVLLEEPHHERLLGNGNLAAFWNQGDDAPKVDPESQRRLIDAALDIWRGLGQDVDDADTRPSMRTGNEAPGYIVLKQWAEGDGPPSPYVRIGLALADVALEYVGSNPSVFGVGSSGEKLIASVTLNLSELLPDPEDAEHWKTSLVEQSLKIFFHAGLKAINQNVDVLVEEAHLQQLTRGVVGPLLALAEDSDFELPTVLEIRDTLLGPVANSAVKTLLEHQQAFLGRGFAPETAIGATTKAILKEAAKGDVRDVFGDQGFVRIYGAVLNLVAERPELFLGEIDGQEDQLIGDLVSGLAGKLAAAPPPFKHGLAAELAAEAIEIYSKHLPARFDEDDPWDQIALRSLETVLDGINEGLLDPEANPFERIFSREQALDIVRIALAEVARTPGMITGSEANPELKNIMAAIARVMSHEETSLVSAEGWKEIIVTALEAAARNPGSLFSIEETDPEGHLANILIGDLLTVASDNLRQNRRRLGVVLFGETLKEAVTTVLDTAVRNASSATRPATQKALKELAKRLNKLSIECPGELGSKEWLWLFRHLAVNVIEDGELNPMTDEELLKLLFVERTAS